MNENWGYPVLKPPYAVIMGHVIGLNGIIMENNHHYGDIYIYIIYNQSYGGFLRHVGSPVATFLVSILSHGHP